MTKRTIGPIGPKNIADALEIATDDGSGLSNGELIRTIATDSTTVDAATLAVNKRHQRHSVEADKVRAQLTKLADDLESSDSVNSESL